MIKVIFTNPYDLLLETEKVNALFEEGLDILHLRKPRYSRSDFKAYISEIDPKYRNRVVLHSYHTLVLDYDLKGIYINKKKRNSWLIRNLNVRYLKSIKPDLTISTSFANLKQYRRNNLPFDYVFLMPLFNHNYSTEYLISFEKDELMKALKDSKITTIGMGGITPERLHLLPEYGFDGFALQSAIWKTVDPIDAFRTISKSDSQTGNLIAV